MTLPGYQSIKSKLILFKIQRCENNWPFFRLFGLCLIYYYKLFLTSICIFVSESMKLISIPSAKRSHKNCRQSFEKWWITLRCYVENTITFSKKSVGNRIENDSADNSTQSIDIDGSLKTVIFKQPQCSGFNFFVDSKTESEIVAQCAYNNSDGNKCNGNPTIYGKNEISQNYWYCMYFIAINILIIQMKSATALTTLSKIWYDSMENVYFPLFSESIQMTIIPVQRWLIRVGRVSGRSGDTIFHLN